MKFQFLDIKAFVDVSTYHIMLICQPSKISRQFDTNVNILNLGYRTMILYAQLLLYRSLSLKRVKRKVSTTQ